MWGPWEGCAGALPSARFFPGLSGEAGETSWLRRALMGRRWRRLVEGAVGILEARSPPLFRVVRPLSCPLSAVRACHPVGSEPGMFVVWFESWWGASLLLGRAGGSPGGLPRAWFPTL